MLSVAIFQSLQMVSDTSVDSAIDKSYQMEITTVDFATHGLNLTSALRTNFADTVQRTTKDAIKRKLTARVSPMTRQTEEVYDPRVYPQVSSGKVSHRSYDGSVKSEGKNSAATACSSRNQSSQKRLTEKRKSPATNVFIPSKSVNSDSLYTAREGPSAKRHRTILPRTNLSQGKRIKIKLDISYYLYNNIYFLLQFDWRVLG